MTFTRALSTNNYGPAKFIVDGTTVANGTHSTLEAALAVATSGDTIFMRPGTYTLAGGTAALVAGVNITAFAGDGSTPNVTIIGKLTFAVAGSVSISNVRLQTPVTDFFLVVSGADASVVNLNNCYFNCSVATGISFTSSNASATINCINCTGNLGTTLIGLFASSSAGTIFFYNTEVTNTGGSSTASTISAGTFQARRSTFTNPITSSGTAGFTTTYCQFNTVAQNVTSLTIGGSGNSNTLFALVQSGSASSVSVGATFELIDCIVVSTNATAAIVGAGTINYAGLVFSGSQRAITTTTQSPYAQGPSATFQSANSGATNTLQIANTSNTASASANQSVFVGGTSAGDAFTTYTVSGTTNWSQGIDNSVAGDPYVLAASTALGTTNVMSMTTAGAVSVVLNNFDVTAAKSGSNLLIQLNNTSNTASSQAIVDLNVGGTSAGDVAINYNVPGGGNFIMGIDNSITALTGDPFKLSQGNVLGTNDIMIVQSTGEINYPKQSAFLGYSSAAENNITGAGTDYRIGTNTAQTEVFDQNSDYNTNGTFTAPVDGKYALYGCVTMTQITAAMTIGEVYIATSKGAYNGSMLNAAAARTVAVAADIVGLPASVLANMDAADTASIHIFIGGGAGDTADNQVANRNTFFGGYLAC